MTKVLVTISMAFDMEEDQLHELVLAVDERITDGIDEALRAKGADAEELAEFWDEFEYYGATVTLRRERVV